MLNLLLSATRIGPPILGIILPAIILLISFAVTFLLIRYFSRQGEK